mgnify:CR=1 FL=1
MPLRQEKNYLFLPQKALAKSFGIVDNTGKETRLSITWA